jgi:hypothetical protein
MTRNYPSRVARSCRQGICCSLRFRHCVRALLLGSFPMGYLPKRIFSSVSFGKMRHLALVALTLRLIVTKLRLSRSWSSCGCAPTAITCALFTVTPVTGRPNLGVEFVRVLDYGLSKTRPGLPAQTII